MSTCPPAPTAEALFAALWGELAPYCTTVAKSVARWSGVEREELFQAGTVAAWLTVATGQLGRHPDPRQLLFVAARRGMSNHVRRERVRSRVGTLDADLMAAALAVTDREPDEWDVLLGLVEDPKDRAVIVERFAGDKSFREIGEAMGTTAEAARQRVGRAVAELRAIVDV